MRRRDLLLSLASNAIMCLLGQAGVQSAKPVIGVMRFDSPGTVPMGDPLNERSTQVTRKSCEVRLNPADRVATCTFPPAALPLLS